MDLNNLRNQTAVWWARGAPDGYGKYAYATAVEIDCRWDDTQELFLNAKGEQVMSLAVVFPDRELAVEGYLYKGEESDLDSDHDNPEVIAAAKEIRKASAFPGLDAEDTLYQVWL